VCTRGSNWALLCGPSTSPLGVMRQQDTPPCAIDSSARLRLRRMVLWSHVVVGAITLFIYLSSVDFSRIPGGTRWALWVGVPVLVPYATSAGYCCQLYTWQIDGPGLPRFVAFVAVLVGGGVLENAAFLGAFGHVNLLSFFFILIWQILAYGLAADYILDRV
jgi:hypothetical protein